jgi:exodeoxyribonuclease-3
MVTRLELRGDATDRQSHCLEAAVNGVVVASIYAPNGNPQAGPKFECKLAWLMRLADLAAKLYASGAPVVLAGDYNVVPTDLDICPTKSWDPDALCSRRAAPPISVLYRRAGPTRFARSIPKSRCTPSGITSGIVGNAMAACVSITFC